MHPPLQAPSSGPLLPRWSSMLSLAQAFAHQISHPRHYFSLQLPPPTFCLQVLPFTLISCQPAGTRLLPGALTELSPGTPPGSPPAIRLPIQPDLLSSSLTQLFPAQPSFLKHPSPRLPGKWCAWWLSWWSEEPCGEESVARKGTDAKSSWPGRAREHPASELPGAVRPGQPPRCAEEPPGK